MYNNNQTQEMIGRFVEENIEATSKHNLIVAGDINVRIGKEGGIFNENTGKIEKRISEDKTKNREGLLFLNFIEERG